MKLVQKDETKKDFDNYTIGIGELSGLVVECADAMTNVTILLMIALFVFSLVGMMYFVNGEDRYSAGPAIDCGLSPATNVSY